MCVATTTKTSFTVTFDYNQMKSNNKIKIISM